MIRNWKRLTGDRRGGIEGLPLQLMILVVIAGVGTGVILGWMGGLKTPDTIGSVNVSPGEIILNDSDGDGIFTVDGLDITITVMGRDGSCIEGATVVLEGAGISYAENTGLVHTITDQEGRAHFTGLKASHTGSTICFLTVSVTKSGYGPAYETQIPVLCE